MIHFNYSTRLHKDCDSVIEEFKKIPELKNYKKEVCVYESLKEYQQIAIDNAEKLKDFHTNLVHKILSKDSNPSTMVSDLVNFLKDRCTT